MNNNASKEVVIIQSFCPHYRLAFYEGLRKYLRKYDIILRLLYGRPPDPRFFRDLPWAEPYTVYHLPAKMTWQPVLRQCLSANLIIVEAASKHLLNYVLLLARHFGGPKCAFWGHGWGHQANNPKNFRERIKLWTGKQADWYFAYTWKVREVLIQRGYDPACVTDVQNAIETLPLSKVGELEKALIQQEFSLGSDSCVALYCGRMYPAKRLDLMIIAAERVRQLVPQFVLILAGGGPDRGIAEEAARTINYIQYTDLIFGKRKAALFGLSRLLVMPGVVGLGVVDAFHYGTPVVATRCLNHGPEFAYLSDGENGLITDDNVDAFSRAIVQLAKDDSLHSRLVAGCKTMAQQITVEEMVRRFAEGILAALQVERPNQ